MKSDMKYIIYITLFLLVTSCHDEASDKHFLASKLYFEVHEENITKTPDEKTSLHEDCWVLDDYWGRKKLILVKRTLDSTDVDVKILCFIDSENIICHEHFMSGCGVGLSIYDTIKWNRKNDLISMDIRGGKIGYGDFNYQYTYKLVTQNDSIIELIKVTD